MANLLKELESIFREVLDLDDLELAEDTTADTIEDWDSLTHIQIIVAAEKKFGIKFTASEIQGFRNVGDICTCIELKQGASNDA